MATSSGISFGFRLTGQLWDPGYDPFHLPPEPIDSFPAEHDEIVYWYNTGIMDGQMGLESREPLIPPGGPLEGFQRSYRSGWEFGHHFYKFTHFS